MSLIDHGIAGYLRGFDVIGLSKYVDHFNFMSYDIHGTWDGNSEYTSAVVNPHTNLTGRPRYLFPRGDVYLVASMGSGSRCDK